jgi:branched-chain amino acid transport system ATP-binding protein
LAAQPRLLLLDEPAAGLSRADTQRVMRLIEGLKGRYTILLIEHKMDVVMSISDRITVMYFGEVLAEGAPGEIRTNPKVREAYLGRRA